MADLSTDAIAALQAVEDWWLTQADQSKGAPACIFMVREVLARHQRTTVAEPPIFVANGGSEEIDATSLSGPMVLRAGGGSEGGEG